MQEVWDLSPTEGNDRLVLLALADNADEEKRFAWPSVATLAKKARIHERTVQRILRRLVDATEISLVREGGHTSQGNRAAVYRVHPGGGGTSATGGTSAAPPVAPVPPQPSKEPSTAERERAGARIKFAGKPVSEELWRLTSDILTEFNRQTGRDLRLLTSGGEPSQAASRVYGRVKAYTDLTFDDHARIISNTLASRWWGEDKASVGVVYGPNVFEENISRKPTRNAKAEAAEAKRVRQERGHQALRDLGLIAEFDPEPDAGVVEGEAVEV